MGSELSTKVLDHLGLVSGMCDELELSTQIDSHLAQDLAQREVSIGTLCKALIINGLGFVQRRLYMVSSFFESKPIELLLGQGIEPSHLNDTVIGRALDTIHAYGCSKLFSQLSPIICANLGLSPRYAHMDSTDFHLDGVYNSENPPDEDSNVIHLTKGYSRDHRPDLNQVVLNLITDNQAGIPIHMAALDGNSNDKSSFRTIIDQHIGQLQNVTGFEYLTMDSAGYTKDTISAHSEAVKWISRVPETVKACKELLSQELKLKPLTADYQYLELGSIYADVSQRWLVIHSEHAYKREMKTLVKNYLKQSKKEYQMLLKLQRKAFCCRQDALKAVEQLVAKTKTLQLERVNITQKAKHKGQGRPSKGSKPTQIVYFLDLSLSSPISRFRALENQKGKFILATNELNKDNLPDQEVLAAYKGLSKVERGFRFLKDPQFVASSLFVKKPERVEALVFIMTLCLTVYAALEYRIRQQLARKEDFLPNQLGKKVQNPTARWIFETFIGIHVLYGMDKPILLNIKDIHTKVIELLGLQYRKYYLRE